MKKAILLIVYMLGCAAIFAQHEQPDGDAMAATGTNPTGSKSFFNLPASNNLRINKETLNWSSALFFTGGVCLATGVTASILSAKSYTKNENDKIIKGKEYNLIYAASGLVASGICVGVGIKLNKKARTQMYVGDNNNCSRFDLVATGNGAGFRFTF